MKLISRPRKLGYEMAVELVSKPDPYYKDRTYPAIVELPTKTEVLEPHRQFGGATRQDYRLVPESSEDREQIERAGLGFMMEADKPDDSGPPVRGWQG